MHSDTEIVAAKKGGSIGRRLLDSVAVRLIRQQESGLSFSKTG